MKPLVLEPIYQTRVWGGRTLETLFDRDLPDEQAYGESWEVCDRAEAGNLVVGGEPAQVGQTLGDLWKDPELGPAIFGEMSGAGEGRFPLLCKILDARERLSLQVHPPADLAPELGGEPKTEMWYVVKADPGAELFVGVKEGVTRERFEAALAEGAAEDLVHRLQPRDGDFIFIPSGRLHAIGAGLLIYEIQQNSDTTYRVFDWNRMGLDGKPRELHVEASLRCIDFADVEPELGTPDGDVIVSCEHFRVSRWSVDGSGRAPEGFAIATVIRGPLRCGGRDFQDGDWFLIPASGEEGDRRIEAVSGSGEVLISELA